MGVGVCWCVCVGVGVCVCGCVGVWVCVCVCVCVCEMHQGSCDTNCGAQQAVRREKKLLYRDYIPQSPLPMLINPLKIIVVKPPWGTTTLEAILVSVNIAASHSTHSTQLELQNYV